MKLTLLFLAALSVPMWPLPADAEAPAKPNIVFILADDLGYMDVGCYNPKTFYETPNIDALAKSGMRFTQGYAACNVCSPTRGSIMTGKYPPRFGITNFIGDGRSGKLNPAPNADHLPLGEVTIAEALSDGGYPAFFAGKWHLGDGGFYPGAQGFPQDFGDSRKQFYYPKSDHPAPDRKDDPKTKRPYRVRRGEVHERTPREARGVAQGSRCPDADADNGRRAESRNHAGEAQKKESAMNAFLQINFVIPRITL